MFYFSEIHGLLLLSISNTKELSASMNDQNRKAIIRIQQLRIFGLLEGISYLVLLLIAMPLKYYAGYPIVVKITGWIHGLLFILFILSVLRTSRTMHWKTGKVIAAFLASVLPFGTFVLDKRLQKEAQAIKKSEIFH